MLKIKPFFLFLLLCLLPLIQSMAQTPVGIRVDGEIKKGPGLIRKTADAGTINIMLDIAAQSTNVEYLCWGDSLRLMHNMDSDLSGDPDPSTQPGIGYPFYDCAPTITGPDLATIQTDPCLIMNPMPPVGPFWIAADTTDPSGSTVFWNGLNIGGTQSLQDFFNAGDPIELFFAPITLDDWATQGFETDGMGGPAGPCIDVNVDETFRVVYLNEIQGVDQTVQDIGGTCTGSFVIEGGVPEFDGSDYDNIAITLSGNPGTNAMINGGPFSHGDTVTFTVPQPGNYNVVVQDSLSCGTLFQMNMDCQQASVTFTTPDLTVDAGDNICVDVTVEDFIDILVMQFSIQWDSTVLQFDTVTAGTLPFIHVFGEPNSMNIDSNTVTFSGDANDPVNGESLVDGTVLFTLCFNVIGSPGECTNITFTDDPVPIELVDASFDNVSLNDSGGQICITSSNMMVIDTLIQHACNGGLDANRGGSIDITVGGGTPPYSYSWSNGETTEDIDSLAPGSYTVTITDSGMPGIQIIETYDIQLPNPVDIIFTDSSAVSCNNQNSMPITCDGSASAIATGGVPSNGTNYTFLWDNTTFDQDVPSSSVNNIFCAGYHSLTVTDDIGCRFLDSVLVPQPPELVISVDNTIDPACAGDCNGSIDISATGGTTATGTYTYNWDGGQTTPQLTDLCSGDYMISVTDDNGCLAMDTITLEDANPLIATIDMTNTTDMVTCNGGSDGFIGILATGGNMGALTYDWSPDVSSASSAANLPAGVYSITVTDSQGCFEVVTHEIQQPPPITATIPDPEAPPCFGGESFIKVTSVSGGVGGPYFFSVDNGVQLPIGDSISVLPGVHLVTIFDGNNCTFETTKSVPDVPQILVDLGPDLEIELGDNGIIRAGVSSSTTIVSADWSPITDLRCRDTAGLCLEVVVDPVDNTEYTLTVTDENGCTASDKILVVVDNKRNVFIPNVFSPNGDGFNDLFRVFVGQGVAQINFMRLFDRWGDLVYEVENFLPGDSDDTSRGWDGTFQGEDMQPAVFAYLVEVQFIDGKTLLYRGDFTLLR